ncbi:MAG: hypothetical protein Q9209_001764 [Squamulea sp. 1 TL-2023]
MDPCTAIGATSAILTIIDIGTRVAKRLNELSEVGDIPEAFRDIKRRLPLVFGLIDRTQHGAENLGTEAQEAFKVIIKQSFDQICQLEEILKKVMIGKCDSRLMKTVKAGISLVEEGRVKRIAASLKENVELLTSFNTLSVEKEKPKLDRWSSQPPPSYVNVTAVTTLPFERDDQFVGRENYLESISSNFETQRRVAISGIGGVGKSQIAIEYCFRYKESKPGAHVLWVYGGTIARFYQGYKRIAQELNLAGWDDPETSILDLVFSWLSSTRNQYLLAVDNADNIEHWWPGKYKSTNSLDDPSKNLSKYLPDRLDNGHVLITTRDSRVAAKLLKKGKPIAVHPMSEEEATSLFLSKLGEEESSFEMTEVCELLEELDHLPLAISQAAAFIQEMPGTSIVEYTEALQGQSAEEYLGEELHDSRRDEDSVNCVLRTWKLSYDQVRQQKPRAAELLCLLAMLDRQSIPKSLLKVPEVTTSLGVLQSFHLITARAGSQTFQLHRLVQRFVQISIQKDNATQEWQEMALACVSKDYPTEIGVAEWPICDTLAPHVHILTGYKYQTTEARLDLAHLLCWAADFDIERGMYTQATARAHQSLEILRELVPEDDERLASATWLYGRLRYYDARSVSDMDAAAELLRKALSISRYPSLNFAESAFELAHLYYDQCNEKDCAEMGKASFECWKDIEGSNSSRTLDNMHDYALQVALFGREEEGIALWEEIQNRAPTCDASENTKTVYTYRSMAGIAEFQDDAAMAEIFYNKLIALGEAMYYAEHIHVYDYRLSHTEQIMRQGRLGEAIRLSEATLESCKGHSEWRISASCLQTIAECYRLKACYNEEQSYRLRTLQLHEQRLGLDHKHTIDATHDLADCYEKNVRHTQAKDLYQKVITWRNKELGPSHSETIRAIECLGICHAHQGQDAEAEVAYFDAISRQSTPDVRLLQNLCLALRNQGKWEKLESWSRQLCKLDNSDQSGALWNLMAALEQQSKSAEVLEVRTRFLALETPNAESQKAWRVPQGPPVRVNKRFGRMIHPRTWSA